MADDFPDISIDFFASPQRGMATLQRKGNLLRSTDKAVTNAMKFTSGGSDTIDITRYDAFAFIFGNGIKALMQAFRHHRTVDMQGKVKARHLISRPAASAVATGMLARSMAVSIGKLIHEVLPAPLFIVSTPTPTSAVAADNQLWKDAALLRPIMLDLLRQSIDALQAELPFTFIHQPEETIIKGFTDPAYSKGSMQLSQTSREHHDDEPHHMNARYGALMMTELVRTFPAGAPR
ncbi:hypothetical protein [Shinella pollutisoli]|uniref:Uncharacterized protein n=1 Tax=Shinella pollutisoli TaxID=2250594 RepID=A0ABV7DB38_9HYPH|nr:hypothetical protein [Shinella pollutisoli]